MRKGVNKKTGIEKETIKMCIWFAESGYNVRKIETQDHSSEYKENIFGKI